MFGVQRREAKQEPASPPSPTTATGDSETSKETKPPRQATASPSPSSAASASQPPEMNPPRHASVLLTPGPGPWLTELCTAHNSLATIINTITNAKSVSSSSLESLLAAAEEAQPQMAAFHHDMRKVGRQAKYWTDNFAPTARVRNPFTACGHLVSALQQAGEILGLVLAERLQVGGVKYRDLDEELRERVAQALDDVEAIDENGERVELRKKGSAMQRKVSEAAIEELRTRREERERRMADYEMEEDEDPVPVEMEDEEEDPVPVKMEDAGGSVGDIETPSKTRWR